MENIQQKLNLHFIERFEGKKFKLSHTDVIGEISNIYFIRSEDDIYINNIDFKEDNTNNVYKNISMDKLIPINNNYIKANINKNIIDDEDFLFQLSCLSFEQRDLNKITNVLKEDTDFFIFKYNLIDKHLHPKSIDTVFIAKSNNHNDISCIHQFPIKLINNLDEVINNNTFVYPHFQEINKMYKVFFNELQVWSEENKSKDLERIYKRSGYTPSDLYYNKPFF